jgi:hypothetical protein
MGANVIAYLNGRLDWWDDVLATQRCPHCQGPCRRHSVRERAAWTQFLLRARERIPLLRIYCPQCSTVFTVLPDFLTPRHRYQVPVREAVVTGTESVPPCCAQTARRWQAAWATTLPHAIHHVTSMILRAACTLRRQDQRFLTGEVHGYAGLRAGRRMAGQYGLDVPASGLIGWVNQLWSSTPAFVL